MRAMYTDVVAVANASRTLTERDYKLGKNITSIAFRTINGAIET